MQRHIAAGRASHAVDLLNRALALSGRYSPASDTCHRLRCDLHPIWCMAFAADEGQHRIRREFQTIYITDDDFDLDNYRMQA